MRRMDIIVNIYALFYHPTDISSRSAYIEESFGAETT